MGGGGRGAMERERSRGELGRRRLGSGPGALSCPPWRFPLPGDAARGDRDLSRAAAAPRSTCDRAAFVYGGPAFGRSTRRPRPGEEGREGGGTAAGAGAANLASRPRRGPGVTGAPPRRGLQGLSQERPARSRPHGSLGECTRRAVGTGSGERVAGPGRWDGRWGGAEEGWKAGRDAQASPVAPVQVLGARGRGEAA